MTQQQGIHDIIAALEHHLTQLERDARKWEALAIGWEARWRVQLQQIAALEADNDRLRAEALELALDVLALQHERDGLETYASEMEWHRRAAEQREQINTKDELLRVALAYEIEHNGVLGEQQDRLRAALGLPPVEPMSIAEWLAEMRERYGHHFDGVDPAEYVRELRDDDEPRAALDAREGGVT